MLTQAYTNMYIIKNTYSDSYFHRTHKIRSSQHSLSIEQHHTTNRRYLDIHNPLPGHHTSPDHLLILPSNRSSKNQNHEQLKLNVDIPALSPKPCANAKACLPYLWFFHVCRPRVEIKEVSEWRTWSEVMNALWSIVGMGQIDFRQPSV
jgi:hypothetical protein